MARAPHRFLVLPLILLCCGARRADWLLDEANKKLLACSPSAKAVRDKLCQDCPGFTLSLTREKLPTMVQLRSWAPNRFAGVVNLDEVRATKSVPELAIASLYFMAKLEVANAANHGQRAILPFLDKVRMELKRADPAAFSILKPAQLAPDLSGNNAGVTVPFTQLEVVFRPPPPPYPPLARAAGIQDTVVLSVTLSASGQPEAAKIVHGHPQLHPGCIAYAMAWRFRPVVRQGRPVKTQFMLEVPFGLDGH
jgi:TonB family protein